MTTPTNTADQPIFQETFTKPGLPRGWYTDTAVPKYEGGQWNCQAGDGVMLPLRHDAWTRLRLEVDLTEVGPNATAFCGADSRSALVLALSQVLGAGTRHQAIEGGLVLLQSSTPIPQ